MKKVVVITIDRSRNNYFKVPKTGRISKADLNEIYQGKLKKVTVLCSNSYKTYSEFIE